jgi:hypothetical protein
MIDFVFKNVKPLEVIVGRLAAPKWGLLVQPVISPLGKLTQRFGSDIVQQL